MMDEDTILGKRGKHVSLHTAWEWPIGNYISNIASGYIISSG